MKKMTIAALVLAAACLMPSAALGAKKVTSSSLYDDYDKYPVVYVDKTVRVYADEDTVLRDNASAGTLPVLRATLYVEVYKNPMTWPDYGNYTMVDCVLQYETAVGASQFGNENIRYQVLNKLTGATSPDGKPISYNGSIPSMNTEKAAQDIYMTLYRLSKPNY